MSMLPDLLPQALPDFADGAPERFAYGARSEAAIYVGDLLYAEVPALAEGRLDIVAIARRPGVLSKVAIKPRSDLAPSSGIVVPADAVARVREKLDGERIQVVAWQRSAPAYIAGALGLGEVPPVLLLPGLQHARVLLGEIDLRGIAGWRGLNTLLASALTGWRIRLETVAATDAWRRLEAAMRARRPVQGSVVARLDRGLRIEVHGLYAVLSGALADEQPGREITVRVTRMDADEGRIFVSDRLAASGQLGLPLLHGQAEAVVRNASTSRG
jgi:transcription antitermination factor NusA-like protein